MGSISKTEQTFDLVLIGSGLSGLCSLYHARQRFPDWRIRVIERAPDVGGTWYYNRYPGCRVDTESVSYCYSFDKEFLQEWDWKDTFSAQPDVQKYIQRFAEKNDLYKDIDFGINVASATWDDNKRTWTLRSDQGETYVSTFIIGCVGFLSAPTLPAIHGIESFRGDAFHTANWPNNLDINTRFAGKRVGVIGTGATGIQVSTALAKVNGLTSLSVFQRTATWTVPLRNEAISSEQMAEIKKNYDTIFKQCSDTPSGFLHRSIPQKTHEVSEEERLAHWESIYRKPGFSKWLGGYSDQVTNREANKLYSDFIANKIRERVDNPEVAESLIPQDHGFGTRRVPLESGYFEIYNQHNVHLVDLKKTPVSEILADGIVTSDGKKHELDILVYATGFDAITGAYRAIEWRGKDGRPLISLTGTPEGDKAVWPDHQPNTYLGMTIPSMPNLLTVMGPHQPVGNATRNLEHSVQVAMDMLDYCKKNQFNYIEATDEAAKAWTEHVNDCSKGSLINEVKSWMTGINTNVAGKDKPMVARYAGPVQEYRRRCKVCKNSEYQGLHFEGVATKRG